MTTAIWIASGQQYIEEAQASARSLNAVYPEVARVLLTPDTDEQFPSFDMTLQVSPRQYDDDWNHDSVRYFCESIDAVVGDPILYFDTDTYICDRLDGLVGMMRRFDFVGVRAPRRVWMPTLHIPDAFCDLNVGVFCFRRTVVRSLFEKWLRLYDTGIYKCNDQSPLREAMWMDYTLSSWIAPAEYNFRFAYGGAVFDKVYVLHGRSKDFPALAEKVNADLEMRSWKAGELE